MHETPPVPAEDRRAEIIATAAGLFDSAGYGRTSMGDLADAVGLAKPTLYHYFRSKDEILWCIHAEFISLLIERHEARTVDRHGPVEQLRGVMGDILELMHTHRGHVRVFFEHHRELPEPWRSTSTEQRDRYFAAVRRVVVDGIDQGAFRDVDPDVTTLALFGTCNWAYQWYRADGPLPARAIADAFHDLVLRGLAAPEDRGDR